MNAVALKAEGAVTVSPRLLSLREAVVLADVPEKEKCVRKDIDAGVFAPATIISNFKDWHSRFAWNAVFAFAAVYGNELLVDRCLRKTAFNKVYLFTASNTNWCSSLPLHADWVAYLDNYIVDIDTFLSIPIGKVCARVKPRMDLYAEGLSRVEEKDEVMGGAAVFRETRLPVHHVAKLVEDGESIDNILKDYPYLSRGDIDFALLYNRARPMVGRPRTSGGSGHEGNAG